jgi:hypothetical protein
MTTAAYANKRTIFDAFASYAAPGMWLDGVQIEYAWPGNPSATLVYGGRVTFEQPVEDGAVSGDDEVKLDVDTIWVFVRITGKPTVRDADVEAERVGDLLGAIVRKNPRMLGPGTSIRIAGGTSTYVNTDDGPITELAYRITTNAYIN